MYQRFKLPKVKKTLNIVVKANKVDNTFLNAIKAQTSGLARFEYSNVGPYVRPVSKSDHHIIMRFLKIMGWSIIPSTPVLNNKCDVCFKACFLALTVTK